MLESTVIQRHPQRNTRGILRSTKGIGEDMSMPKRYLQPPDWPPVADYKGYLENEVLYDLRDSERIRKRFEKIPKLGEMQSAELLLKLASYINSVL